MAEDAALGGGEGLELRVDVGVRVGAFGAVGDGDLARDVGVMMVVVVTHGCGGLMGCNQMCISVCVFGCKWEGGVMRCGGVEF